MILEILAGTHPGARRMGEWLDAHPAAALAVFLSAALLASVRW